VDCRGLGGLMVLLYYAGNMCLDVDDVEEDGKDANAAEECGRAGVLYYGQPLFLFFLLCLLGRGVSQDLHYFITSHRATTSLPTHGAVQAHHLPHTPHSFIHQRPLFTRTHQHFSPSSYASSTNSQLDSPAWPSAVRCYAARRTWRQKW